MDRDLTCSELVELVTEYLDGGLSMGDAERFEEHLTLCPACVRHFEQMRATIEVTGSLRGEELDPGLTVALLAAFRDWRRRPHEGAQGPSGGRGQPVQRVPLADAR